MKRLVRAGLSFPSSHHLLRAITIRAALRRMTESSASVDHGPRSSEQVESTPYGLDLGGFSSGVCTRLLWRSVSPHQTDLHRTALLWDL